MRRLLFISLLAVTSCITAPSGSNSDAGPDGSANNRNNENNRNNQNNQNNARDMATSDADSGGDLPAEVPRFASVVAGRRHACALTISGDVWCWGQNSNHAASERVSEVVTPTKQAITDVVDLAAGDGFTCALRTGGEIWCWGKNDSNQVSDTLGTDVVVPTLLFADTDASEIEAGRAHVCIKVNRNGATGGFPLQCWGDNRTLQANPTDAALSFVAPSNRWIDNRPYLSFSLGSGHTCARRSQTGGLANCWGENTFNESLGLACDPCGRSTDRSLNGGDQVIRFSLGAQFGCGLTNSGQVYCFGKNDDSQLGNPDPAQLSEVVPGIDGELDKMSLGVGYTHSCVVVQNTTQCWGSPALAIGADEDSMKRAEVQTLDSRVLEQVSSGEGFSCGVANDTVYCWGLNDVGQLGRPGFANTHEGTPIDVGL